jgi:hypothetical protein
MMFPISAIPQGYPLCFDRDTVSDSCPVEEHEGGAAVEFLDQKGGGEVRILTMGSSTPYSVLIFLSRLCLSPAIPYHLHCFSTNPETAGLYNAVKEYRRI